MSRYEKPRGMACIWEVLRASEEFHLICSPSGPEELWKKDRSDFRQEKTLNGNQKSIEDINVDSFPSCLHQFFPLHLPVCCEVTDGPWLLQTDSGLEILSDQNKNHIALNQTTVMRVNGSLEPVSYYQYSSDIYFSAFHCWEYPENHQHIFWIEV